MPNVWRKTLVTVGIAVALAVGPRVWGGQRRGGYRASKPKPKLRA